MSNSDFQWGDPNNIFLPCEGMLRTLGGLWFTWIQMFYVVCLVNPKFLWKWRQIHSWLVFKEAHGQILSFVFYTTPQRWFTNMCLLSIYLPLSCIFIPLTVGGGALFSGLRTLGSWYIKK